MNRQGRRLRNKLEDLQVKYSFQEDLLQSLNEIIVSQQKELAKIKSQIREIREELVALQENHNAIKNAEVKSEIPPHY